MISFSLFKLRSLSSIIIISFNWFPPIPSCIRFTTSPILKLLFIIVLNYLTLNILFSFIKLIIYSKEKTFLLLSSIFFFKFSQIDMAWLKICMPRFRFKLKGFRILPSVFYPLRDNLITIQRCHYSTHYV